MISLAFPETEMFSKEIFLFDRIENLQRSTLKYLKCVCIIRPSHESVNELINELRAPKYAEYHICITRSYLTSYIRSSL